MGERQPKPVTLAPLLVEELWAAVKELRDEKQQAAANELDWYSRLDNLLDRMEAAGMSEHLPTLEEVQAAWRG